MLVPCPLPWRDVHDFRKYRPEVLAFIEEAAGLTLRVDRGNTPYVWTLARQDGELPLQPAESALRTFFQRSLASSQETLPAGHTAAVPLQTVWSDLCLPALHQEQRRFDDAVALAAQLSQGAPASAASDLQLSALSEFARSCLRTICLESPLHMCQALADPARELILAGYAQVDFRGHLRVRGQWELPSSERRLERVRQTFAE